MIGLYANTLLVEGQSAAIKDEFDIVTEMAPKRKGNNDCGKRKLSQWGTERFRDPHGSQNTRVVRQWRRYDGIAWECHRLGWPVKPTALGEESEHTVKAVAARRAQQQKAAGELRLTEVKE